MAGRDVFHAFDGEYWKRAEWPEMPETRARIHSAIGDEPLEDARHLVPPLALSEPAESETEVTDERVKDLLRRRHARAITLTLVATRRPYPARDVWRAALSMGFRWGNLDLFHWTDDRSGETLFTLHALGGDAGFLPERAAEGGTLPGIVLALEVPYCPDPPAVFDRMALALAALRERLGGVPRTDDGQVLDVERLEAQRREVEDAVLSLERNGVPPGSETARRLF